MTMIEISARDQLLASADALTPQIEQDRDQIEQDRRLPAPLVTALTRAGFFRMWVPAALGGLEVDPATGLRVIESLSAVDGSVGWCVMIGATGGLFAGFLPEAGAREVYGSDPTVVTGGSTAPTGRAVPVAGGYRLSGRWPFASGSQHCAWLLANGVVMDGDQPRRNADGSPDMRLLLVPAGDFEIIDTWTTGGLRGTGSHDFAVSDVFVPEHRSFAFLTGRSSLDRPLYRGPITTWFGPNVASVALGIARGAIDTLSDLAGRKVPTYRQNLLRERVLVQMEVAKAEALLRSARAFLYETVDEVWRSVSAGAEPSVEELHLLRLAGVHAADSALAVVESMYKAGGGTSVYTRSPLDRQMRDVHAATQHIGVSHIHYELAGRIFLGMEPGTIAS
jgi:alkylation response protein AidB-like acyl-CoA dehydrogenase